MDATPVGGGSGNVSSEDSTPMTTFPSAPEDSKVECPVSIDSTPMTTCPSAPEDSKVECPVSIDSTPMTTCPSAPEDSKVECLVSIDSTLITACPSTSEDMKVDCSDSMDSTPVTTYPSEDIKVECSNNTMFRDDNSEVCEKVVDGDDEFLSGEDSEEEFEKILQKSYKMMKGTCESSDDKQKTVQNDLLIENEYTKWDPVVLPEVHLESNVVMKPLGKVKYSIDCLLVIETDDAIALDYDSFVFDEKQQIIGQVFDVLGNVRSPMYTIRFNSPEECLQYPIGMAVYIAPDDEHLTKLLLVNELSKMRIVDSGEGEEEEMVEFSDDEEEKKYRQQKEGRGGQQEGGGGGRGRKRPRGGTYQRGGRGHHSTTQGREMQDLESFFTGEQSQSTVGRLPGGQWPPRRTHSGRENWGNRGGAQTQHGAPSQEHYYGVDGTYYTN